MRITLLIIGGFLLFAAAGFYSAMSRIRDDVERQYSQAAEEPLVDFSHLLAAFVEEDIRDGVIDPGRIRSALEKAKGRSFEARIYNLKKVALSTEVYVTDREGTVIFDSESRCEGENFSDYNDVARTMDGRYGARATRTDPANSRSTVFHVAAPIHWNGEIIGTLTVSRPEKAMAPFADETRLLVLRTSLIAGAAVAFLGALWTYWLLSPIGRLTQHARHVRDGGRATVPELGHVEIRSLSRALEDMRRELAGRNYVENYVKALTHELKSPLAAIQGAAELLDEGDMPHETRMRFLGNIRAETERCEDMVRRLVQLAALENQATLEKTEKVDVAELVTGEIDHLRPLIEAKKLSIESRGTHDGAVIEGDRLTLQIAVRNLLNNAIDFSPENGAVRVSLEAGNEGEASVILAIEDEGPGVPDYAVERVFERFFSLKHSATGRKGSGLGLCFVREAMELHGGEVKLENRPSPENGARATLLLRSA